MRVVIAPDSFKESLTAAQAAAAIARGWQSVFPQAEILQKPMADGGEGTVDALLAAVGGERRAARVAGPLGQPLDAHWGLLADSTAVIEMAEASGLQRVPRALRDATRASSFGTGQLLREALHSGAGRIILALGGSATNDGGAGMLQALGVRLLDAQGAELPPGGAALARLQSIDVSGLDPRLAQARIEVAADVDNPLCGPRGASAVFGPQKGASLAQVTQLDGALARFADCVAAQLGADHSQQPGVGAAGGLGFAARAFLDARFRPGVELVAELSELAEALRGASLVITGEGRLDTQSLHGKAPLGVARLARQQGVPCIALAGSLGEGYQALYGAGIDAAFSLTAGPVSLDEACATAAHALEARTADVARLWQLARRLG